MEQILVGLDPNVIAAIFRDFGFVAGLFILSIVLLARSPFSFKITGNYSFSVGKNGHFVPDKGDENVSTA